MTIHPEMRVRDVAERLPASLRLFERFGVDYCCGGGRSLREGCARSGAPLDAVLEALHALESLPRAETEIDWRTKPVERLVDHLIAHHHAFARSELDRLVPLAEKVHRVHGAKHPELEELRALVHAIRDEVLPHLEKEEAVLFPWVLCLAGGPTEGFLPGRTIAMPIRCMTEDHEELGELLARLRATTKGHVPPEGACGSFRALYRGLADLESDLHRHVYLENEVLFPAALALAAREPRPALAP